jgi:hypothetical protein
MNHTCRVVVKLSGEKEREKKITMRREERKLEYDRLVAPKK